MGKEWLLWTYDPCPEGGWQIHGRFKTQEDAVQAAQDHHSNRGEARVEEMRKYMLEKPECHVQFRGYRSSCYERCIVTPSEVYSIEFKKEEEDKKDVELIRKLVLGFFVGDQAKADLWFESDNPLLGDISPNRMIELDRVEHLGDFVINQIRENLPPKEEVDKKDV